jgi:hypothetical protein
LGYYNKKNNFKITTELENIFKQYNSLKSNDFEMPISEIALVKSKYKNLRYPKLIQKFRLYYYQITIAQTHSQIFSPNVILLLSKKLPSEAIQTAIISDSEYLIWEYSTKTKTSDN